jgi:endo-1,4-beta-xylanase
MSAAAPPPYLFPAQEHIREISQSPGVMSVMSSRARVGIPGSSHSIGYNIGSLSGSYNNFSIYGWTTSPLIEYYVCEKGSVSGTFVNSISSDGHTYNFYKHQQINQPSIQGNATFWQYLDNWGGAALGANNSVTTANHINNWKSHGGQGFGTFNLQILEVEAFGTKSGSCNATVWGE